MKSQYLLIGVVLGAVACSNSGANSSPKPSDQAAQTQPQSNGDASVRSPAASNGKTYEDLKILQDMVSQETSASDKQLDRSEKLQYVSYASGTPISLAECEVINSKVSARYKLHSYEVTTAKGYEIKKGTDLCPNSGIKYDDYIMKNEAKMTFSNAPVKNQLGVSGAGVLKILVLSWPSARGPKELQFMLDSKFNIIEMTVHDENQKEGIVYNEIASLSPEGNVLGRVEKVRPNMNEEYLWKGASTFVSADGKISSGMRVYQNDGKGTPAVMTSYTIPYNYKWESYEASPLTRIRGIYLVNGKTESWPKSQLGLSFVSKSGATCGNGYIGYTDKGDSIRDFGDIQCEAKMDVQTSRR